MTKSIIDKITGQLKFSDDFAVCNSTNPKAIIDYFGQTRGDIKDMQTGWKHYSIRYFNLSDSYFSFTFFYKDESLKLLDFIVNDQPFYTASWADWSEQKELEKRDNYNNRLTNEIGNIRKFSWGTIDAFYDKKSGSSSIILRYNQ